MPHSSTALPRLATEIGISDTPDGLDSIGATGCAATIWRRQPMPGFQAWIDALDPAQLPSTRLVLRPNAVEDEVRRLCDAAGLKDCAERLWLEADITDLAHRFARLMRAPFIRLRLDVVTNNACSKFHIDAVITRLICTYRSSGTQYGIPTNGREPDRVFQVATGAPMILRGTLCPKQPPSGLLHRSPPIAGTGETRLLLVLDPVYDLEDAV